MYILYLHDAHAFNVIHISSELYCYHSKQCHCFLQCMQTFGSEDNKLKQKLSPSKADAIHTSKVKLFLLASIVVILSSVTLTRFSQNFADELAYISKMVAYPHCILTGKGLCSMTPSVDEITVVVTTLYDATAYFLLGGLTYFNLIFPLKPSDLRKMKHRLCCLCAKYSWKPLEHETQRAHV